MTTLTITGMTCGHCQNTVAKALEAVEGVTTVAVNLESGLAEVDGSSDPNALVSAIEEEGFNASISS